MMLLIFIVVTSVSCDKTNNEWVYSVPVNHNDGWEATSVEDAGISLQHLTSMMNYYKSIEHKVHSILIVKGGKLLFEEYFPGYTIGSPNNDYKGNYVNFSWDRVHITCSVTKSFTSALVGIAIDKEFIKNEKVTMFSYFPDYSHLQDEQKSKITIEHLLSNTSGLEWDDSRGPEADRIQIWQELDPLGFILDRPVVHEPGTVYLYSGGNFNLAGEIVKRASGLDAAAFSKEYLFKPLEVSQFRWGYYHNNVVHCSGDLFVTPRTMAKFGYLFLNKGIWKNTRVISEQWINKSVAPYIKLPQPNNSVTPADSYGLAWWIYDYELDDGSKVRSYSARGLGGQKIIVLPVLDTVVVFTQGYYLHYYHPAQHIMDRYILPAIL
jgi:CubicO group peptidase (beta-lactamase class C family)